MAVFFFYSGALRQERLITGYVKPVFKDMKIYGSDQEKGKPVHLRKVYERLVRRRRQGLENRSREEVATKSDVSGRIDNPGVSVVDVVLRLVQNAFFKAILPGFDLESGRAERTDVRPASR